ncbi:hypothetical protein D3C76_1762540 [compost metagenome]
MHTRDLGSVHGFLGIDRFKTGNVFADAALEQLDVLRQVTHMRAQVVLVPGTDIRTVQAHYTML